MEMLGAFLVVEDQDLVVIQMVETVDQTEMLVLQEVPQTELQTFQLYLLTVLLFLNYRVLVVMVLQVEQQELQSQDGIHITRQYTELLHHKVHIQEEYHNGNKLASSRGG
jgi:hypothetical protein